jgi:CheY-like chemotaxis protein
MLVLKDKVTLQDVLSKLLFSWSHHGMLAGNGFVGEPLFLARLEDLVIVDVQMPWMNAWELSRIFNERSQGPPRTQ